MRGKFPSRKNGRVVHHEGLLELDALYLLEASPQVSRYREQPSTITYADGPRVRRYTPDLEVTLSTGEIVWIEVKPSALLRDDDLKHKLEKISLYFSRRNQPFLVLTDEVLRSEPRQSNLRTIFHRANHIPPSRVEAVRVLQKISEHLPAPLSKVTALCALYGLEPYSLLLAGLLRCDLDIAISTSTQLSDNKEADDGWFWLAQKHGF